MFHMASSESRGFNLQHVEQTQRLASVRSYHDTHQYRKKHRSYVYSKRVLYVCHVTVGGQTIQHRVAEAQHGQVTTMVCLSRERKRRRERRGEGEGEAEAGRQRERERERERGRERQTERGRERQMCARSTAKRLGHALGVAAPSREVYHVVTVSTYD